MDETTRQSTFQLARTHAFDRYLSALLAPAETRDALMTWAAVTGEIERIPFIVTDPMIGEIRFQWWLDWLDQAHTPTSSGNPLADAMSQVIRSYALPVEPIRAMIEARIAELYADPVADFDAFATHLEETEGTAFWIGARFGSKTPMNQAKSACLLAGRAYGTARVLAKLPEYAAKGRWPLPLQSFDDGPGGNADILAPENSAQRAAAAVSAARFAIKSLADARASVASPERALRMSLLPLALVEPYLAGLEKAGRDPLLQPAGMTPLTRVWRLWRAS